MPEKEPKVIVEEPHLKDLNLHETVVLGKEEQVRLFTVLDGAVFYFKEDDDQISVKLPSFTTSSGYRDSLSIDISQTQLNAEDITALYIMRIGSMALQVGAAVIAGLFLLGI